MSKKTVSEYITSAPPLPKDNRKPLTRDEIEAEVRRLFVGREHLMNKPCPTASELRAMRARGELDTPLDDDEDI